ncbi:LPS O-antigen chain length determinant protein WzzB [Pseudomonas sp. microsymbiont 2]
MPREHECRERNDEIDLSEWLRYLLAKKLIVASIVALSTLMALVYAFLATPLYQVSLWVQPPMQKDIAPLNYVRGEVSGLSLLGTSDVYGIYLSHLQSEALRRRFFQEIYLPSLPSAQRGDAQDALFEQFRARITVDKASRDGALRHVVSVELPDARQAADWVVRFTAMAGALGREEAIQNVQSEVMLKARHLEQDIRAARSGARQQREDKIHRLTEALAVAQSIGLRDPLVMPNAGAAGADELLTYMRGTKALEAQIGALRTRTMDDPFVEDLRQREELLSFYQQLRLDEEKISVYRQDGQVQIPDRAIKPKKAMIVLFGFVIGCVMAVALVLLMRGVQRSGVER